MYGSCCHSGSRRFRCVFQLTEFYLRVFPMREPLRPYIDCKVHQNGWAGETAKGGRRDRDGMSMSTMCYTGCHDMNIVYPEKISNFKVLYILHCIPLQPDGLIAGVQELGYPLRSLNSCFSLSERARHISPNFFPSCPNEISGFSSFTFGRFSLEKSIKPERGFLALPPAAF